MQIPDYLEGMFKLLENYGYQVKKKHGNGTRRIIKFDQIERSLMLSYKLPDDDEWGWITPDMAMARKQRDNRRTLRMYESTLSPPSTSRRNDEDFCTLSGSQEDKSMPYKENRPQPTWTPAAKPT